jgi:hypothetical protein
MYFVTGGAFTDEARDFLESVRERTIDKPFSVASLRATVAAALDRRAASDGCDV